jgi:hypothetical protein
MSPTNGNYKRPVRVAGASGGQLDRVDAVRLLAQDPSLDAIVGDWMSENVMTVQGAGKVRNSAADATNKTSRTLEDRMQNAQYAGQFINAFKPAILDLAKNGIKLAVNAGGSDTELLAEVCQKLINDAGCHLKVAWVEGDNVMDAFTDLRAKGEEFQSLTDGRLLSQWGFDPIAAQCYLGSMGIAEALRNGADIVICGRVADAAPAMGVAM